MIQKIANEVVNSMRKLVKRTAATITCRPEASDGDDDEEDDIFALSNFRQSEEAADLTLSVFYESEKEFMRRFHQRYRDYAAICPVWKTDELVKSIDRRIAEKGPAFAENEALHTALDEHKYVIRSRLLNAIDRLLNQTKQKAVIAL